MICMPNTDPTIDTPAVVQDIQRKAETADARVFVVACATTGMAGQELTDTRSLLEGGRGRVLRRRPAHRIERSHARTPASIAGARVHRVSPRRRFPAHARWAYARGRRVPTSSASGVWGPKAKRPWSSATSISSARSVESSTSCTSAYDGPSTSSGRQSRGLVVTSDACPHHFILTDEDVPIFGHGREDEPPTPVEG